MNNFTIKLSVISFVLLFSIKIIAQPTMSAPTVTGITSTSATLGGTIGGTGITARGTSWKISSPVAATDNQLAQGGTSAGTYTHTRSSLPAGTQIFFVAYGTNGGGTAISSESSFYTLSTAPLGQPASFTSAASSTTQINLTFPAANTGSVAATGYVIYRFTGTTDPDLSGLVNAAAPPATLAGSTLITTTNNTDTNYADNSVTANNEYHYAIVPFGYSGNNATYNFLNAGHLNSTSSTNLPTISSPNATTISDVSAILGGTVTSSSFNAITERGTVWKTTAGVTIADSKLVEGGTSVSAFTHTRSSLTAATQYFYKAFVSTAVGTALTSESSFYTLSTPPTGQPASFTATTSGATAINLNFSAPSTVGADGYIILRRQGTVAPNASVIVNGIDPASNDSNLPGGTTRIATFMSGDPIPYPDGGLTTGTTYSYTIVPFTFSAASTQTYNYLTTGALSDSDTPSSGVTITGLSGAVCAGTFSSLSDLVIDEGSKSDFSAGTNVKIVLSFSGPGYIFQPNTSLTTSFTAGANITAVTAVADYSSITITYSVTGTNKKDQITISGIKAQTSSSANSNSNIVRIANASDGVINGGGTGQTYGTISSGAPGTPSFSPITTGVYCENPSGTGVPGQSVTVAGAGIKWYSLPSLSPASEITALANNNNPTLTALGFSVATDGTFYRYATVNSGCAVTVPVTINPAPTADAGSDQTVANSNSEICSDAQITLGGTPTLAIPSVIGTYTYGWVSSPVVTIPGSTTPNPTLSINNSGSSIVSYTFTVTVTDANGCSDTDTKNVDINPAIVPVLTQPNSTTFSTNTPAVILDANPSGGIFSGVGVVQTGPSTYKFSASLAYDNTSSLPQTVPIKYTFTSGGCTVTNYPIATMTLSNQLFATVASEYCSSENPTFKNNSTGIRLSADVSAYNQVMNDVNYWNNTSRFYYSPLNTYPNWNTLASYTLGQHVRYLNEDYTALSANSAVVPLGNPGFWQNDKIMKVQFNGTVRNYYEGANGGNNSPAGSTVQMQSSTYTVSARTFNYYEMLTNTNYVDCPSCDYNYPAFYIDFVNANDMQYLVGWQSNYYYYPNDVVFFGGQYYKCILTYSSSLYYSYNQSPTLNPSVWQATGSNFDTGARYKSGSTSGFYSLGQYISIHKIPQVAFTGLTSGLVNATEFCSSNTDYTLIGSSNGTLGVGNFDMSYDNGNTTPFQARPGLANGVPSAGQATFNGASAYLANNFSTPPVKQFYIRYSVDPGTKGSTGQACISSTVQTINVNLNPTVSFASPTPADNQFFCYDHVPVDLATTFTSSTTASVALTGFGVTNLSGGTGKFDPAVAINQLTATTGINYTYITRPTTNVTATVTDANGCKAEAIKPLKVNPLPPASVAPYSSNLCYTGATVILDGQQTNAFYTINYKDVSKTVNVGTISTPTPDTSFDPSDYFDDAVALGANALATLSFDVVYTSYDPDQCVNSLAPVNIKVAPQIPVKISGINDLEEFCSNQTAKQITLTPTGGNLSITRNGLTIATPTITAGQFSFSPIPLAGGNYVFNYDVITGNNCSNPTTVNVKVLPSPVANFLAPPKCQADIIAFNADGSQNNNGTPVYTWTFEGALVTGQNTTHQFSGLGTYNVNLNVEYPAAGTSNTVCSSSLTLDQYVGTIPTVDFDIADVCIGDATKFNYSASTPISQAQWDFGDGNLITFGSVNQNVPVGSNTTGTYGNPIHTFSAATTYTVTLTGRTSAILGNCANTKTRSISILQYLKTSGPLDPYSMKALNNENGFWVAEDKRTNSTWEFAVPNSNKIISPDKSWVTNANGFYRSNDQSYVNSPCLDLSAFTKPSISVNYRYNTDPGKDGAVLQYSIDGGANWIRLGDTASGLDWYNDQGISAAPGGQNAFGWSGTGQKDWQVGKHSLNAIVGQTKVRFRIAFASDEKDTLDGFAFNDVKIEERNRLTLVESFTNVNAVNAAPNRTAFQAIPESEVVKVEYFTPAPGVDPNYLLNTADFNSRAAYYGLTNSDVSIPRGFIDGVSQGTLNSSWATTYQPLRSLVSAPFNITVQNPASTSPDEITAKITLTALSDIQSGKLDLQILIIEKQVGSDKFVLRKMLPSAAGTRLTTPIAKGASINVTESWIVKNIASPTELAIVAFVQDQSTLEVLQADQLSILNNLPTVITGLEDAIEGVRVYPNPADRDFTIQLPAKFTQGGSIIISDQLGKVISENSFSVGAKTKTISTRDLAEGLYIIKIKSGKDVINQKVIIVHQQ